MLTIGGYTEKEAWVWDTETYQKLGEVVYLIVSGKPENRRQGYIKYFELRNHFLEEVFNLKILMLDNYRKSIGRKLFSQEIEEIRKEMVEYKFPLETELKKPDIPPLEQFRPNTKPIALKQAKKEEVEQLDLFST